MPLHVSSTMCSSSGGQNCIIQPLVSSHSLVSVWWYQRLYNTIFDLLTMRTWCSKHVQAWNKPTVKQILCIKLVIYQDKYTVNEFKYSTQWNLRSSFKVIPQLSYDNDPQANNCSLYDVPQFSTHTFILAMNTMNIDWFIQLKLWHPAPPGELPDIIFQTLKHYTQGIT